MYLWFIIESDPDPKAQRAFVSALLDVFEKAPARLGLRSFDELPIRATRVALHLAARRDPSLRRWMVITIVRQLRFPLDALVLIVLWNHI